MGVHDGHRERRREQFLRHGEAMADHELLELLLFYAIPRRDTNPIAHQLLERFGSLQAVLGAPVEELEKTPGMGRSAAVLVKLVAPLYRRARVSAAEKQVVLDTVERIGAYFLELFVGEQWEVLYQLCLDAKGRRINTYRLSDGDAAGVAVNVRRIVENAILSGAVMVALAHNHPSGVAFPSQEDRDVTRQVQLALDAVGVKLVEHVIVADGDFVSLRQQGFIS